MDHDTALSRAVTRRMEQSGMSARQLCRRAGMDSGNVSRKLAGRGWRYADLHKLAAALGVAPHLLVAEAGRLGKEERE